MVLKLWCHSLEVGDLKPQSGAFVSFYHDRVEYLIRDHPEEREVDMYLHMRHFTCLQFAKGGGGRRAAVRWRIPRPLEYFSRYYDHRRANHFLVIRFSSPGDAAEFERMVWPTMQALACG